MKTNASVILVLLILVVMSSACVHYYYAPNSNNVPLFKEKNEARIQAQYSTAGVTIDAADAIDGFEIQSAYAVGNHAALQLNFFHADDKDDYGSGNGNYIEAAAGYFKPLTNKICVFETYAGIGTGSVRNVYEPASESAKTSVTKFFVQPSFGFSGEHFGGAFSSKFSIVNIGVRSSSVSKENNSTDYDYIETFKHGKSYFCWEPGFMIRGGFKNLQAFVQATYSVQGDETLPFCNANYSIGVIVPFKVKSK